ncbi:MAG: hypothetical protein M9936_06880 [Caldilinea sp.]|nr:hypothetical protein [Caldilinea sp.]MCB0056666.1 hypothetical protein [Caldilineaceae bacterium]MCB0053361.1 hypothetical protein [Caldilinea sp.]MCB9117450.1 hypothetical protein [Caldilineaceae bacterium]MCB9119324.1 hypothetical protein [Caldilineaceae bacterium]
MDYFIVLLVGILLGWLMTWFWFAINRRWTASKSLRQSHEKTMKEVAEKGKKAREDKRKARSTAMRAVLEMVLFGAVILLLTILVLNYLG